MSFNLSGLNPVVIERIYPFFNDLLISQRQNIHSIYIVGSSITPDFDERLSDINSVFVFHRIDFDLLRSISLLGKRYYKKKIAAPLLMTVDYIYESLDVFPVELLEFKLIHQIVYGDDIFNRLEIDRHYLRLQCEREIKSRMIGLRQGYISSLTKKENLADMISRFIIGYIPILRAIIYLSGEEPSIKRSDVVKRFSEICSIETESLNRAFLHRERLMGLSFDELDKMFESLYIMVEKTGKFINEILP